MIEHPPLPEGTRVLPGTDVAGEWERFEVFEALHHTMRICNPMSGDDLDALLDALSPVDGETMLDLACGHGELLLRAAERAAITGIGLDLSPWVLHHAAESAAGRSLRGRVEWWLGNAREAPVDPHDLVTILGASWVWHGFEGTVRAAASRTSPGGRLAVGDLQLQPGVDAARVTSDYGRVMTRAEQAEAFDRCGVELLEMLDPGREGWDRYRAGNTASARAWAEQHPGPRADEYLQELERWTADHDRDVEILAWVVWVGRKR
jgi:SAM-dependent methyltransferase